MSVTVVVVVLASAVLHATWNALAHATGDTLAGFVLLCLGSLACALPLVVLAPPPDPAAWPFIAASVVLQVAYQVFLLQAYRLGEFGQVYPLARGTSPWVVAVLSATVLGHPLPAHQWAGVLTLSLGLVVLTLAHGVPGRGHLPALAAAFGTGLMIAAYTVVDGSGVRHADSVLGYIGWEFLLQALPLPLYALLRHRRALPPRLRAAGGRAVVGGALSAVAYGLVVWAQNREPANLPAIAALRETSIVLGAVIGAVVFHERFGRVRLAAGGLVVAGIVLLELVGRG
ncbi:EamA family transporter [Umezawaea tangerina]|uniref:EamA-like transporter family protein n=1 Tax=Umezawaea tangerina TaxID=84725 RepID=A0A2T0SV74_9PSEU|nr:EamA family transporter [Umezawaea tangerina]PRY37315.1 EamA-like transporter family protein [Umezawaea tangerina]